MRRAGARRRLISPVADVELSEPRYLLLETLADLAPPGCRSGPRAMRVYRDPRADVAADRLCCGRRVSDQFFFRADWMTPFHALHPSRAGALTKTSGAMRGAQEMACWPLGSRALCRPHQPWPLNPGLCIHASMTHPIPNGRRAPSLRWRDERGFTLLELLVVLGILALLATFAAPQVLRYLGRAKSETAKLQINAIASAVELYALDNGGYPAAAGRSAGADARRRRARRAGAAPTSRRPKVWSIRGGAPISTAIPAATARSRSSRWAATTPRAAPAKTRTSSTDYGALLEAQRDQDGARRSAARDAQLHRIRQGIPPRPFRLPGRRAAAGPCARSSGSWRS